MRAHASFSTLFILLSFLCFIGCTPEIENFKSDNPSDFFQLQPGKFITYRLDSTVYTDNGRNEEIHSYQEKDVVDAEFIDNLGRKSYRIFRYIRGLSGTGPWKPISTFTLTADGNSVEMVEDNLRILQLAGPVKENTTWKGNRFLPAEPYKVLYDFENDRYMKDWEFKIDRTGESVTLAGKTFTDVITVTRVNEQDVPDTVQVNNNTVTIKANDTSVWIRGNATGNIIMNVANPTRDNFTMYVYNNSNRPAILNSISTPPQRSRVFEFVSGAWTFGATDAQGNRIDEVSTDLLTAGKTYAVDQYAKNIGLIAQELTMWEFQPNQSGTSYKVGFGVKRTLIDHN